MANITVTTSGGATSLVSIGSRGPVGPTGPVGGDLTSGPVTSTAGVSVIADNALTIAKTNGLQSALNDKVDDSQLSTTGGANKVPILDANGNLYLAPLVPVSNLSNPTFLNGNLILRDARCVLWAGTNGSGSLMPSGEYSKFQMNWLQDHPGNGIMQLVSSANVGFVWEGNLQLGWATGGATQIKLTSGGASAGTQQRQSNPVILDTATWTSGASVKNPMAIQAAPFDLSGTSSEINIYNAVNSESVTQDLSGRGTKIAAIHSSGIWSAGTAPTFNTLASADTITHTVSKYKTVQVAKTTLNRPNTTIAFSAELAAGMRGVIYVTQDNTGGRFVSLPSGSYKTADFVLSTGGGLVDRLSWEYDGASYYWTIEKGLETVYDLDTQNFISAISLTDNAQKVAVNNLVLGLKQANLWTRLDAIYPLVGGTATTHAQNLRQNLYHIINDGTTEGVAWGLATHNTNGVTGNGSTAFGSINGYNLHTLGRLNSVFGYAYSRSTDITALSYLFGATDSTRFGISRGSATSSTSHGPNDATSTNAAGITNWKGHHAINRDSSTSKRIYYNAAFTAASDVSTTAPNYNMALLARRFSGPYAGYTNANVAFYAFGTSFSESEFTTFRGIIDTFQTALSRQN